jgi:hypothetical protein
LRIDLRAQKKLVAANLKLTVDQATKSWPVYDQYVADQTKIHDQKYAVIQEFATSLWVYTWIRAFLGISLVD